MSHVNNCPRSCVLSCILNQLIGNLGLICDVLAADFIGSQAERTALSSASWALAPADRTNSSCSVVAWRITESSALNLIRMADQRGARTAAVGALSARDSNISHASRAIGRADAAANIMEAIVALWIPEVAPLFTARSTLVNLTSTSSIGIGLVTVGTIIAEACVMWAVLPAYWANTRESIFAVIKAKGTILFFAGWAIGERLTCSTSRCLLPA